jgi:hypothetical protein
MKIKEIGKQLKKAEIRREEAEIVLLAARQEMEKGNLELSEAEGRLTVAEAAATAGGWIERRKMGGWRETVEALRGRLSAAEKAFAEKEIDVERLRDEVSALRFELAQPFIEAVRKQVVDHGTRLQAHMAAAEKEAKGLAALYQLVVEQSPRRIVSQRVPDRFWRVHCPAMEGLYPDTKPPGAFSMEPIKAMAGERAGKWKIIPGQDLGILPEDIETAWGDAPLPAEVEAIRDRLDLGVAFSLNGGKKRELSFAAIAAAVTPEDVERASKSIEEGN